MPDFSFAKQTHPVYDASKEMWQRMERLMAGGSAVADELLAFQWEVIGGEHHSARKRMAVYPKYPDRYASVLVGHLMRSAPEADNGLSFGTLGNVARRGGATPSSAELVYYNVDGVGGDGSQWDAFWMSVAKMAIATGHRWLIAEGPRVAPVNKEEEINGLRPFVTHYSPVEVLNWHHEMGRLRFLTIERTVRQPVIVNGILEGNKAVKEYLLFVARGWTGFDPMLPGASAGTWFTFNADCDRITASGTLDTTKGVIPAVPVYYERVKPTEDIPRVSRSGIEELGNAAVAYMNIRSASDFDAWDSAASLTVLVNVTPEVFNTFLEKVRAGSRFVPLPPSTGADANQQVSVQELSAGNNASAAFKEVMDSKRTEALELMTQEIQSAPYASGRSKRATWTDTRAPRLTLMASEIETAQNAIIQWLEMLWGKATPSGSTNWPKNFELFDVESAARDFLEMESIAGVSSETVDGLVLTSVAKRNAFIRDDETEKKVLAEYSASAAENKKEREAGIQKQKAQQQASANRRDNTNAS